IELIKHLNGSLTGEHGDGILRSGIIKETYKELYELFVEIKRLFDPNQILNPGKKLSDDDFASKLKMLRF
ncbi:MAG: hypothetical protein HY606_10205, partial [Planctomycetes bacterium]|nr:hypothetical protein [Planctomycetota bacterium]